MTPSGLLNRATRLISAPPAAASPDALGRELQLIMRKNTSSPAIRTLVLDRLPNDAEIEFRPDLPAEIEARLGLAINEWGEPQPLLQR